MLKSQHDLDAARHCLRDIAQVLDYHHHHPHLRGVQFFAAYRYILLISQQMNRGSSFNGSKDLLKIAI